MSEKIPFTYIEVVEDETQKVVKRIDVTDQTDSRIERIERGLSINLNHARFSTRVAVYKAAQVGP